MTLSKQFLDDVVTSLNHYPSSVVSFPPVIQWGIQSEGPLIYPCSGSDVTYPLLMFPDIEEFVLLDEHPLFSDPELIQKQLSELLKIEITPGYGAIGNGYDLTRLRYNLQHVYEHINSNYFPQDDLGGMLFLRLRKLVGLEFTAITEIIPGKVLKIEGNVNGSKKQIYFVRHFLGAQSDGYQWLLDQHFSFKTIFAKAFSACISHPIDETVFQQLHNLVVENISDISVVTEKSEGYKDNNHFPHLFDPEKITTVVNTSEKGFDFGYSNLLASGRGAMYASYPRHIVGANLKRQQIAYEAQEKARLEHENSIRLNKELICEFRAASLSNQLQILTKKGIVSIDSDNIQFVLKNKDEEILKEIYERLIMDLLKIVKSQGLRTLKFVFSEIYHSHPYQAHPTLVLALLDSDAANHIETLEMTTDSNDEKTYLSVHSVQAAMTLKSHGKYLRKLHVSVNDEGAKAFVEAARHLIQNGNLREVKISPINSWREDTQALVDVFYQEIPDLISRAARTRTDSTLFSSTKERPTQSKPPRSCTIL